MIRRLFVLWRDRKDRTRHVIGQLWRGADQQIHFSYEDDLRKAKGLGFQLLPQFPRQEGSYSSAYLFSTFVQRIPSPARPDYLKTLQELGLASGDDPLEVLARGGGTLMTDSIELAEHRSEDDGLSSPLTFRLAGERFVPGGTTKLQEGDQIELIREHDNPHDAKATVVLWRGNEKIGYVPRYYTKMLAHVLDAGAKVRGKAVRRIRMPEETRWIITVWKDGQESQG
jgi:hypothetical protein